MTITDLDNNGRIDMCNSVYETECPQMGVDGACCNPCWGDTLGDILPGGWFAYGINGTCACLLYTSDAADERSSVDLGGRRIIKKKNSKYT